MKNKLLIAPVNINDLSSIYFKNPNYQNKLVISGYKMGVKTKVR
jgi:hypothetical protein